ncbi:unnamed protein product [Peniophora sp. CBMAI 1063]|nr:unnamed protein product [Peniophora sp. CBMAI 1063]
MDSTRHISSVQPRRVALKGAILISGFLITPEQLEVICVCHDVPERETKGALRAFNDYLLSRPGTKGLFVTTTTSRDYVFVQATTVVFDQEGYDRKVEKMVALGQQQYLQRLKPWLPRTVMENHPDHFNVDRIYPSDAESDISDGSDDSEYYDTADVLWVVRSWGSLSSKPLPDNIKIPAPSPVDIRLGQVIEVEISLEDEALLKAGMSGTASNALKSSSAVKHTAHGHTNGERKLLRE